MTIDVFADIACPWCYVGEARLQRALEQRPHLGVTRRWRPFQLQPGLPREGVPWKPFAEQKFGGAGRAAAVYRHLDAVGEEEGIAFDFEAMPTAPNTRDAHRLVLLGETYGRAFETAEAFFRGYFAEGRDLGDPTDLVASAEEAGLPGAAALDVLGGDRFAADVDASQETAARLGVTGVPLYVFGGRLAVSGAQPTVVFLDALDWAATEGMEDAA